MKKLIIVCTILLSSVLTFAQTLSRNDNAATIAASTHKGNCGENLTWILRNGQLSITGSGAMFNYGEEVLVPWRSCRDEIISITIGNNVASIGSHAFYDCKNLKRVTIPNSVTAIGIGAFTGCVSLTDVKIPNSVTHVGVYAFGSVPNIQYQGTKNESWGELTCNGYLEGCFVFADATKRTLTACVAHNVQVVDVPNTVTTIGGDAFGACTGVTVVNVPNTVTNIEHGAFVNIPNVMYRGGAKNSPWAAVTVNGYVEGNLVFADATKTTLTACNRSATTVVVPMSVTTIQQNAFRGCEALTTVMLPPSLVEIASDAFMLCSKLKNIKLPNSLRKIGDEAFYGCASLTTIVIPAKVTEMGVGAFQNCSALSTITIPNGVAVIESRMFAGCENLTTVVMHNKVKEIGSGAFSNCVKLKTVKIPNSVTEIRDNAFNGCKSIKEITLPSSLETIYCSAFNACDNMMSITSLSSTPPAVYNRYNINEAPTFGNYNIVLYVPRASLAAYKAHRDWSKFNTIRCLEDK